jgi:alanine dehydrogenase
MANPQVTGFEQLAQQSSLYPQESLLAIKKKKGTLSIGLPKEISLKEHRIALTPEAVRVLVRNDHQVWIEQGAGVEANYSDHDYSEAGATIMSTAKEVFQADVILKIEPLIEEEFVHLRTGSTLISAINLPSLKKDYFEKLNQARVTAIGYELLEDQDGGLPIIRAMSEIAGSAAMLIAAEYLSNSNGGKGVLLGGITGILPTKVVILGAGTVAEYAARVALGLGADIRIFDKHLYRL